MFDYRRVAGTLDAESRLDEVVREAPRHPGFAARLAHRALDLRPPLGAFDRLVTERRGSHAGTLDIKHRGLLNCCDRGRPGADHRSGDRRAVHDRTPPETARRRWSGRCPCGRRRGGVPLPLGDPSPASDGGRVPRGGTRRLHRSSEHRVGVPAGASRSVPHDRKAGSAPSLWSLVCTTAERCLPSDPRGLPEAPSAGCRRARRSRPPPLDRSGTFTGNASDVPSSRVTSSMASCPGTISISKPRTENVSRPVRW